MNLRRIAGVVGATAAGLAIVVAASGAAVPRILQYQGRATNSAGVPLTVADVAVSILSAPSAGTVLWSHSFPALTLDNGRFSVVLDLSSGPNQTALNSAIAAGSDLYVQASINSSAVGTPQRLSAVTYALRAQVADTASVSLSAAGSVSRAALSDSTLHVLGAYVSSTVARATLSDSTLLVMGSHVTGTVARASMADSALALRGGAGIAETTGASQVTIALNVTPGNAILNTQNNQDLLTLTLQAPANGVIVVDGVSAVDLVVSTAGTTNVTAIGINQTATTKPVNLTGLTGSVLNTGDLLQVPVTAAVTSLTSVGSTWATLNCTGRFAVTKGTNYTFYLAGQGIHARAADTNQVSSTFGSRTLRATFYAATY